jgi:tetratricopeptide (TPR) repeat protein
MQDRLDILRGELERLFSTANLKELCADHLGVDPAAAGLADESKAVFARRIIEWCERNKAVEALADAMMLTKKGMVDPRVKQIYQDRFHRGAPVTGEIPGFGLGELIGEDGVGAVFACTAEGTEAAGAARHAVWIIHGEHALDTTAVQRFLTQLRVLQRIDNESIQQVERVGLLADGRPFAVIRWIEGATLAALAPLPLTRALAVFAAVLEALDAVHALGLIHADLRPENVLVRAAAEGAGEDAPPHVVLLGLGVDKLFHQPEPPGPGGALLALGMVKNLAPELARGNPADIRSDIYGLGALLFEAITGKPVFPGRCPADVLAAHLTKPPPEASGQIETPIPGTIDAMIGRLLAKSPAQRPRDIAEVRKELVEARRVAEEAAARAAQTGTLEDIETWADALIGNPGDREVLEELFRETRRCNAWGAAVQVLEEAAAIADDVQIGRRLLLAAADGATRHLKDFARAGEILSQLQEADPGDEEIAEAQLRLLRAEGRFETLIEKLVAKAEAIDNDLARLGVIREIAEVYEKELKEPGRAFDYYLACLGAGIEEELVERLERLAVRSGRLAELAASCAPIVAAAEQSGDTEGAIYLYRKLGGWYLERLDQPTHALTCFQKVLDLAPADTAALEALADLYRGAQQWKELAEALIRLGEAERSPARGRDRLAAAARVQYERLSETDTAREIIEGVLAEDPAHAEAGNLAATIHEKSGNWDKLAALLARKADGIAAGSEQAAARVRLGEIYEDRLSDLKSAREQFVKARSADARNLDALKGLERICARQSDHAGLHEVLEQELELAVTPRQRVLLLERLAEIDEEEFRDDARAIARHAEIRKVDPAHKSALIVLTRLYRRSGAFEELAGILEERAGLTDDADEKRELLHERAEVIREDIGDAQRAAAAFAELASHGAGDEALDALARTQAEAGDFAAADGTLGRMAEAATAPERKIALMLRRATLQCDRLEDRALAAGTLRKARDLAPRDRGLIAELARVYQLQGNFSATLGLLEEELELAEGSNARAEIYARMGLVALGKLKDEDKAIGFFEHALAIDKSNLIAGDNVSTLYRKRGDWAKALPIYELWAASAGVLDDEKKIELFTQMGEAYDNLGRRDDALASFRRAATLASEPRLMRRLGEVALGLGEHTLAREQLSRYLEAAAGTGIEPDEKVQVLVLLGRACLAGGDAGEAAKLARQATVMAPEDNPARLLLAEVHEERGDFRGAVEARQRVLEAMGDGDPERLPLVRKTASLLFEKLRDSDGASRLLTEEIERHPEDRDVLGDLLKIYYAAKRYADVVEVVLRIADLVDDPGQLARYYVTVAKIYRRELKQLDEALTYFELAVEQDPSLSDAEEALVEILSEREDWERLEKHYKKAIARLPKDALVEEKLELYRPLAGLLLEKLDREQDGLMITEVIAKLAPEDVTWREKLAGLYGWRPEHAEKAVALHRSMLEANPARVESFRGLYRIFSAQEEPDRTWCAASMLALLNQASPDERKFYRDFQPEDVPQMQSRLKDEHWGRQLFHPELNQNISAIFSVVGKAISKAKAQPLDRFGLSAAGAVDPARDESDFCRFLNFAAGALGIDPPPVHFHEGQGGGFALIESDPPALVVGKEAQKLKDRLGLAFALGQQLTVLKPGLFVHRLVSSGTELSAWLLASIKIFVPALPVPADLAGPVQERLSPIREALTNADLEKLQGYVQSFVSTAADVNLKRWARAIDRTGDRAGLLLAGDVAVAVRVLKPQIEDKAQLSSRLRDLTLFTISDEHHLLRTRLGYALKNG